MRTEPARQERLDNAVPATAPIIRWGAGDRLPPALHRSLLRIRDQCFPADIGDPLPAAAWRWLLADDGAVIAHAAGRVTTHAPARGPALQVVQVAYVGVVPSWQKRGLAGRLIEQIKRDLPGLGLDAAVLHAAAVAMPLYLRCGFVPIAPRVWFRTEDRTDPDPVLAWAPDKAVVDALRCPCWVFESDW